MHAFLRGLVLIVVATLAMPLLATDYYIGPSGDNSTGTGTSGNPWANITHALSQCTAGDSVILLDGDYDPQGISNRTFTGQVIVRAQNDYKARLRSTATSHRVLSVYGCTNLSFRGLLLEATTSAPTSGSSEYLVHISAGSGPSTDIEVCNCIVGDSYYQDTIKVNGSGVKDIWFRECVFYNNDEGFNIFDINTVTDVDIEDCIFFHDYAGSGRPTGNIGTGAGAKGMILIKNSGSVQTSQRFNIRRNVFFSYQGASDYGYIQLGEDDNDHYEVTDCVIENNLFISEQTTRIMGVLGIKDCRQITYRANTQVGHMNVVSFGVAGFFTQQTGSASNPGCDDLNFFNNIWADNTGSMVKFSAGDPAGTANLSTDNNVYWNNGNAIPNNTRVLEANMDNNGIFTDPALNNVPASIAYPRWNNGANQFPSGNTTIRQEFERLVNAHAPLGTGSSAIDAANATNMPSNDILGNARGGSPDCGCIESGAGNQPPVADAQVTGTLEVGNTITLDGSGSSDPDSQPTALSYSWSQISGPGVTLSGGNTDTATFTATTAGGYTFELTVDDGADIDTDSVTFAVTDPDVTLDTSDWTISATTADTPKSDTRTLTYNGTGTLTVSVSAGQSWVAIDFDNGSGGNTLTGGNGGTITVTVADVSALSNGQHTATIDVTGNDGVTHDFQITFRLNVSSPSSGFNGGSGASGGGGCAAVRQSWKAIAILAIFASGVAVLRRLKLRRCGQLSAAL